MNLGVFTLSTIVVALIVLLEKNNVKKMPVKDKVVFLALLFSGWILTGFDLPNLPGLTTLLNFVFKPFKPLLET